MEELDYKKTLLKNRMVYNVRFFEKALNFVGDSIVALWLLIIGLLLFYDALNGFGNTPSIEQFFIESAISFILLSVGILVFVKFININKLEKIEGISKSVNKEIVQQIINESDWNIFNNNKDFVRATVPSTLSSGRQLYILFSGNLIYFNFTTYGHHDLKSPFHFIADRNEFKELKKNLISKIESTVYKTV